MIPIICIPVLNRGDLLARCLRSIDYPVGEIFIINNGNDPGVAATIEQFQFINELPIVALKPSHNLGCASSWNLTMRRYCASDYWLFIGNDMELGPGDLAKIDHFVRQHPDYVIAPANWGHSLFAVLPRCRKLIGQFDENFYPAYCEDQDQMYRIKLAGAPWADVPDVRAIHGEPPLWGSTTVWSDSHLLKRCSVTQPNNHAYYARKWGGPPGEEKFTTPYNDPKLTLVDWIWDQELAEANQNPNFPINSHSEKEGVTLE